MATKGPPDFVVVTGLSGSGKSQAVKVFEDLDYYTLDNLPPALMKTTLEVCRKGGHPRVAFVIDARSGALFAQASAALDELEARRRSPAHPVLRRVRRGPAAPLQRDPAPPSAGGGRRRAAVDRRRAEGARRAARARRQGHRHDAPLGEGPPRHAPFALRRRNDRDARPRHELRLQERCAARRRSRHRRALHGEPLLHTRSCGRRPAATRRCATSCWATPRRRSS